MNAIDLLTHQHRHIEHLFDKLLRMPPSEVEGRRAVAARIAEELLLHTEAEERHLYPAVESARTADLTQAALQDHLALKRLLADLVELDPRDPAFEDAARMLRENLEAHVEQEEAELFPAAEQMLGPERLADLAMEMESTLREIQDDQAHRPSALEPTLH